MTGGFPLLGALSNPSSINDHALNCLPAQLTAPGSTNTKSAWSQFVASSAGDCCALYLKGIVGGAVAHRVSIDIGFGGAGSEVVVVADLFFSTGNYGSAAYTTISQLIPLNIPAGTRVAARYQSDNTGMNVYLGADLFDGGFTQSSGAAGIDALGFTAATTASTSVTAGTSGSKGSYAQVIASTAVDYAGLMIEFDGSGTTATFNNFWDIAVGGAGSEAVIIPNYYIRAEVAETIYSPGLSPFFPVNIPAGSRLAARVCTDSATAQGIVLHGVRA
jgi:hypothetical protein